MKFRMISARDPGGEWDRLFTALPADRRDVHASRSYALVQEMTSSQEGWLAVWEVGDVCVIQPFMMRRINIALADRPPLYDLSSPYGYGGPFSRGGPLPHAVAFQRALHNWCETRGVVSEFCCQNPMFDSMQEPLIGTVDRHHRSMKKVVVIDLASWDLNASGVSRRIRRGVRQAESLGCSVIMHEDPELFSHLYERAMERKVAHARWKFGVDYWRAHGAGVGARWFFLRAPGGYARGLLTIGIGPVVYAHFLGSDGSGRGDGYDEMIYARATDILRDCGYVSFHIGGGLSTRPEDKLFAFKSGFSDQYLTGRRFGRIFKRVEYDSLVSRRALIEMQEHGRVSNAMWFPAYRRDFE